MIIEKHEKFEAAEQVYDIYEIEDVELIDGTGQRKNKIQTVRRSELVAQKESRESEIALIDKKISEIDNLK